MLKNTEEGGGHGWNIDGIFLKIFIPYENEQWQPPSIPGILMSCHSDHVPSRNSLDTKRDLSDEEISGCLDHLRPSRREIDQPLLKQN